MEGQEILQDIVFVTLYGGVIMLNVVVALYLLLRRGNAIAPEVTSPRRLRMWSAAFMIVSALSHIYWPFYAYNPTPTIYVLVCGLDILLLFPSIAGVLLSMLQDRHRVIWPVLVMLIPAFVLMSMCIIRGDDSLYALVSTYVMVLYALLMLYMFFAVRHYRRWLRDNYADLENKEIWQSLIILAVFLLFFIMYSTTSVSSHLLAYLLQIDCIIIVGLLLWRVETLPQLSESAPKEEDPSEDEQKVSASPAIPSNIGPLLKKRCEDRQLYLQNDLTLAQLAQIIGTNRYYLSLYFAQQGQTYNAYINGLRVSHFIRLYHEAVANNRIFTAQQLAFESGFHSYSTFSATFKQIIGMTVTQWIRSTAE
ncbi:MAG: helix-turn-helix transcriptional regulator [Bacteroidales bacterium]|nr:helix-turn-helix transcriptional regulator [Bacteroidales bacterium]